jgi:hypothetical protein
MAGKEVEIQADEGPTTIGLDASAFEFKTIHEEAARQLDLTVPGDTYVGQYIESEWIDPMDPKRPDERFLQARFRDPDGVSAINCGYELRTTFDPAGDTPPVPGAIYRIELRRFVDVGQQSAMKSYRIDVATNADYTLQS